MNKELSKLEDTFFKDLDKISRIPFKEDKVKIANDIGFKYYTEAIFKLYKKYNNAAEVGRHLKCSAPAINVRIKSWGITPQSQGGRRWGIYTDDLIENMKVGDTKIISCKELKKRGKEVATFRYSVTKYGRKNNKTIKTLLESNGVKLTRIR